jgi:hypothetical protein
MSVLDRYREIWLEDSEFIARPSERPDVVTFCAKEHRSGRVVSLFRDEIGMAPPYGAGTDVLVVNFSAAEAATRLALGWPAPVNLIDLRTEHINQTNKSEKPANGVTRPRPPRSLIDIVRFYHLPSGDPVEHKAMTDRVLQGWPYMADEREWIKRLCAVDVAMLGPLLDRIVPGIRHWGQALARGAYVALTAEVEHNGIPYDPWAMAWLHQAKIRRG